MKIFLSYRRTDSEYLAGVIAEYLRERLPTIDVFFDRIALAPGTDFVDEIERQLAESDVLVAIIGPDWESGGRLHAERDFVRLELTTAQARGVRIIPVLHSRSEPPSGDGLPGSLAFVATTNALHFRGYPSLPGDLALLQQAIVEPSPELVELRNLVWLHYERGEYREAVTSAENIWLEHGHQPNAAVADCCRIAALSLFILKDLEKRPVWYARAISSGVLSGSRNVVATSLLPTFFQLSAEGLHAEARSVLEAIEQLIDPTRFDGPMMRRMIHQKRGWSLARSGLFDAAIAEYDIAIEAAGENDPRGRWLSVGGRANCYFYLGDISRAQASTKDVLEAASANGWRELERAASQSLERMTLGGRPVDYEVT